MWAMLLVAFSVIAVSHGFYVPGVAPVEFKVGDVIDVKAIKLTSTKTILPYEYYTIPFCLPEGELHYKSENLGEVMRGDRIVNTPFKVQMKTDLACGKICAQKTLTKDESSKVFRRIKEDYHVHLLVDNLPVATPYVIQETGEIFMEHGYRLGYVEADKVYLNNHLDIVLKYHEPTLTCTVLWDSKFSPSRSNTDLTMDSAQFRTALLGLKSRRTTRIRCCGPTVSDGKPARFHGRHVGTFI
ncbi:hypothetical protein L596_010913 [Steinernema carpocapsae]|nr:hypothetical protein L596_010913 [Steinernema carpocapsae]